MLIAHVISSGFHSETGWLSLVSAVEKNKLSNLLIFHIFVKSCDQKFKVVYMKNCEVERVGQCYHFKVSIWPVGFLPF